MKYTCKLLGYHSLQGRQGEQQQQDGFQVELLEPELSPAQEGTHSKGSGENNTPRLLIKKKKATDAHSTTTSKGYDMAEGQALARNL